MPIPVSRSPTMGYGGSTLPSERGRRPIIVDPRYSPASHSPANYTPRVIPSSLHTPADIYSYSTRRDLRDFRGVRDLRELPEIRLSREMSARDAHNTRYYHTLRDARPVAYSMPTSFGHSSYPRSPDYYRSPDRVRASRPPRDYAYPGYTPVRRRRENERPIVLPSSMPALGRSDVYGTSYESNASGAASPANATVASFAAPNTPSPVANGKKKIRWKDEERRKQNERINSRPVLPRDPSEAADNSRSPGKLKSILKKPTSNTNARDWSRGSSQASPHSYSR
ncbi:hypothetical protein SEPCBS57363_001830 [Sporothrix epigloea]|uniref:Uncharacterized protein n=1 Tax=Sporothrix epigloea TaxID=1892477 RepID=A0ABP0DE54_9PEZI